MITRPEFHIQILPETAGKTGAKFGLSELSHAGCRPNFAASAGIQGASICIGLEASAQIKTALRGHSIH
eukprot:3116640-Amphidinium_carterae.1